MIDLHPVPETDHRCPFCEVALTARSWYMPGMRMLADLVCPECDRTYYGDLPSDHGVFYPGLIEQGTGTLHAPLETWFTDILVEAYDDRRSEEVGLEGGESESIEDPVLLNCLDINYAHCINKLLNAQRHLDRNNGRSLVVTVPKLLEWMVPEGIDAVWTVDISLSDGGQWNDWLAKTIQDRIEEFDRCALSIAYPHPHPAEYDISRFTGVDPFPMDEWVERLSEPTVTFV